MCIDTVYASVPVVNHDLQVVLNPSDQSLQVTDHITLVRQHAVDFTLHAGLQPRIESAGATLVQTGSYGADVAFETYRVLLIEGQSEFTLSYSGKIAHEFSTRVESPGRKQQVLAGNISSRGVFLDAGVAWYPLIADTLQTFTLKVSLPKNWSAISQGKGPEVNTLSSSDHHQVTWQANRPQDDIYLVAGEYEYYSSEDKNGVEAQVFLRQADAELAQRYLDVTHYYLDLYQELIGEYPYTKFALVENFWETGFGMPSFTLLGPRVIRLPFILHSSYPHEILHNWWGNGVFVDYASGNWSEGLTTYLADHLIKEQGGKGMSHRRSVLQRFANFVRSDNDFPLQDFRSRHSSSSQAVGYDKSLMFFHQLRRKLGDKAFIAGLRQFYKTNLFKTASFRDLQQAFEAVSQIDLSFFFKQWLERKGAPALSAENIQITQQADGYRVDGIIKQRQEEAAFALDVPIFIYLQGRSEPERISISLHEKSQPFSINVSTRPVRVDIDPWFDLFRQVDPAEVPSTLGKAFGSQKVLFVLPSAADNKLKTAYQKMAKEWAQGYDQAIIKYDNELESLPGDHALWLMGWQNLFYKNLEQQLDEDQQIKTGSAIELSGYTINKARNSVVLTLLNPQNQVIAWVGTENINSLPGLTRKLPHYGKYSYLVFEGDSPTIEQKGQWAVNRSPMQFRLDDTAQIEELKPAPLWPRGVQ